MKSKYRTYCNTVIFPKEIHKAVEKNGGFASVVKKRSWQKVRRSMGLIHSSSSGNTLRLIYIQYFGTSEGGLGITDQGGHHINTHRGSSTLRAKKKRPRRSNISKKMKQSLRFDSPKTNPGNSTDTCRTNIWTSKQRNNRNNVFLPLPIDARTLLPLTLHSGRIVKPKEIYESWKFQENYKN